MRVIPCLAACVPHTVRHTEWHRNYLTEAVIALTCLHQMYEDLVNCAAVLPPPPIYIYIYIYTPTYKLTYRSGLLHSGLESYTLGLSGPLKHYVIVAVSNSNGVVCELLLLRLPLLLLLLLSSSSSVLLLLEKLTSI